MKKFWKFGQPRWDARFKSIWLLGIIAAITFLGIKMLIPDRPAPPEPIEPTRPPSLPPERLISGKIRRGETFSQLLRFYGFAPKTVATVCAQLKRLVNLRKMEPGNTFELRLSSEGSLLGLVYRTGPAYVYELLLMPSGEWSGFRKEVPLQKYWVRISGQINNNLFEAMDRLGESDDLAITFAEIFDCEFDFNSDSQPGDLFQLVVEKYYTGENFVKYGRILFAEYQGASKKMKALYYRPEGRQGDYYSPAGDSLRKVFLRSPLKFTRITSGYSRSRRHPILGGARPHYGIDYAAPPGTPVMATADGTVIFCGSNGGYGNQVIIKHAGGYESMYGHLLRFAPDIRRGRSVRQSQVIGYVGSTGLATGPHLDFRLLKNGSFRNPLRETPFQVYALQDKERAEFQHTTESLRRWIDDPAAPQYRLKASLTTSALESSRGR